MKCEEKKIRFWYKYMYMYMTSCTMPQLLSIKKFLASSLFYFLLIGMVHHVEIRLCSKPMQRVYYEVGNEDCDDDDYHDICDNKTVMNFAKEGKLHV